MICVTVDSPLHSETDPRANLSGHSPPQAVSVRLRGLLVGGPCWAALTVAVWLTPAEGGHGTHEQLGVPPCSFLSRTGWPCPSCGLTTSLSAMAHGRVGLGWRAQPFGVLLFAAVVTLGCVGLIELIANRPLLHRLRPGLWWVWVLLVGMAGGWGWQALVGYLRGVYPLP